MQMTEITVNGVAIPHDHVLREMQYHPAESADHAMQQAAQCLVLGELLRQQASRCGLPDISAGSAEQVVDVLLNEQVITPKATDPECRLYYQSNPGRFTTSPLVAARHILLAAPPQDPGARDAAQALARQLIVQLLENPEAFSILAAEHSRCESAKVGGDLGQLSRGQTVPEFERHVFGAPVGLVQRPIETRYGFHVVQIDLSIPGKLLPYELVSERIENYLNEKVRRKAVAQYLQVLVSQADIQGCDFGVSASLLMQ